MRRVWRLSFQVSDGSGIFFTIFISFFKAFQISKLIQEDSIHHSHHWHIKISKRPLKFSSTKTCKNFNSTGTEDAMLDVNTTQLKWQSVFTFQQNRQCSFKSKVQNRYTAVNISRHGISVNGDIVFVFKDMLHLSYNMDIS